MKQNSPNISYREVVVERDYIFLNSILQKAGGAKALMIDKILFIISLCKSNRFVPKLPAYAETATGAFPRCVTHHIPFYKTN